jgi:hypothetical protein
MSSSKAAQFKSTKTGQRVYFFNLGPDLGTATWPTPVKTKFPSHQTNYPSKEPVRPWLLNWNEPEWTSLHDCTSWPFCPQDGLCFSSASSPYINQHSTTVKFLPTDVWPFYFGPIFSQPWPSILPCYPTYSTDLPLRLNLEPNPYLPFLSFPCKTYISSWLNLYLCIIG